MKCEIVRVRLNISKNNRFTKVNGESVGRVMREEISERVFREFRYFEAFSEAGLLSSSGGLRQGVKFVVKGVGCLGDTDGLEGSHHGLDCCVNPSEVAVHVIKGKSSASSFKESSLFGVSLSDHHAKADFSSSVLRCKAKGIQTKKCGYKSPNNGYYLSGSQCGLAVWEENSKKRQCCDHWCSASSGLGLATAKAVAETGKWHVIVACRDFLKTERAAKSAGITKENYTIMHLDISSLDSPTAKEPSYTAEGFELSVGTNHLGHFLLSRLLLDDLNQSNYPSKCLIIVGSITGTNSYGGSVVNEAWGLSGNRVQDYSLYTGALGTAYLVFKAYQFTQNENHLKLCSHIVKACDSASTNSGRVTFICGQAGVCALGAALAKHAGDERLLNHYLTQFKDSKLASDLPNELLYGRVGFLWACAFLNKHIGKDTISTTRMRAVVDEIIKAGRRLMNKGRCPLMYEWHGKKY
ncbi:hypothetical protein LWI28_026357 [Acer negundo]|uniref:Protochlorophyllide reductase n=1 Tax=Acer negundo TaxID=4023 RepID=A0AAD5J8E9_ACENE|nr:hypothetical protein LWI28_026357 [Acer negundo]